MIKEICVIDIETTGFSKEKDCILELGATSLNLDTGERKPLFNATFKEPHFTERLEKHYAAEKEHHNIWIFDNSDMTVQEIMSSKDIEEYRPQIQAIFDKYQGRITAWNRPFDAGFLEYRGFNLGAQMSDPMRDSTDYFQLQSDKGGYKWPKVTEAMQLLFPVIQYVEEHRGLSDSDDEALIIGELIKLGVYKI